MKKEEVSQDDSFLEGHQKATWALDEHGRYVVVPSRGYEPERIATTVALLAQDRCVQSAWERARQGTQSPLGYHLAVKQWTLGLAAAHLGISRFRVWWHLRPFGFRRLSASLLARYCQSLDLEPLKFTRVPEAPELSMDEPRG